jgi:phage shock protein PspC (stress-responsive transcriptional regulator)
MSEIPTPGPGGPSGPSGRTLYRSRQNRWLAGVCGGIGEHFGIDPIIIRILWILFGFTVVGIFVYIILAVMIPEN